MRMHVLYVEMLSRIVTLGLSRGCLSLLEGRLECQLRSSSAEYSEWTKAGVPELTTINEIKVNLQELVQSSKIHTINVSIIPSVYNNIRLVLNNSGCC